MNKIIKTNDILHSLFHSLQNDYTQLSSTHTKKSIHTFRVNIKKLKAFLELLNFNQPKKNSISIPGQLKKAYAYAGKIREMQLLAEKIKAEDVSKKQRNKYLKPMTSTKKLFYKKLSRVIQKKYLQKAEQKIRKKIPASVSAQQVVQFLLEKRETAGRLLHSKPKNASLHTARKNLKAFVYITELFPTANAQPIFINKGKEIADNLGLINDMNMAIGNISKHICNADQQTGKAFLQTKKKWKTQRTLELKSLQKKIDDYDYSHTT